MSCALALQDLDACEPGELVVGPGDIRAQQTIEVDAAVGRIEAAKLVGVEIAARAAASAGFAPDRGKRP